MLVVHITIIINDVDLCRVWDDNYRKCCICTKSQVQKKVFSVFKGFIISDIDIKTLSVSGGVRGEGHKRIVGGSNLSKISVTCLCGRRCK